MRLGAFRKRLLLCIIGEVKKGSLFMYKIIICGIGTGYEGLINNIKMEIL